MNRYALIALAALIACTIPAFAITTTTRAKTTSNLFRVLIRREHNCLRLTKRSIDWLVIRLRHGHNYCTNLL
jgi:hypothetical protein